MSRENTLRVLEDENPIPLSMEQARVIEAVSPTVDLERVGNETHMTVKDLRGTHSAVIYDGEKGDPGEKGDKGDRGEKGDTGAQGAQGIPGGHRVTITDADHPQGVSFDVMDGSDADAPVQDVQVHGTSILQDGVANVPIASPTVPGVVKYNLNSGIGFS